MANVLLIEGADLWGSPRGGQSAFAKQIMKAFGNRIAVVGFCSDRIPLGRWIQRSLQNQVYEFFGIGRKATTHTNKPLIPRRISVYIALRRHMKAIRKCGIRNVFIQSPEVLFAVSKYEWNSMCYRFAGVNNPVSNSRYSYLRILGGLFEWKMIKTLQRVNPNAIIASADQRAIDELFERTGYILDRSRFHQFPTRVDTERFFPMACYGVRQELGLSQEDTIIVTTGRLCWIKGWDLLLRSLAILKKSIPKILLIFVGDGEDHRKLKERAQQLSVFEHIRITGFIPQTEVVKYINAADVCTVGSHKEGWSLVMCEIIACGKAVVSTDVSGARDMVHNGKNGFVVTSRDPKVYAEAMINAMELVNAKEYSISLAKRYTVKNLARELGDIWRPLSEKGCNANTNCS